MYGNGCSENTMDKLGIPVYKKYCLKEKSKKFNNDTDL